MSKYDLQRVDLSIFPEDKDYAQIPGKIFLADNFDASSSESFKRGRNVNKTVQISMAVFFLCFAGELNVEVNHQKIKAIAGQVVIALPGSFFRYENHSPNARLIFIAVAPDFVDYTKDVKLGIEIGEALTLNPCNAVPPLEIDEFLSMYKILKRKLYDGAYMFKEEVARNFLNTWKCNLFNNFLAQKSSGRSEHPVTRREEIFRQFIEEVKAHYLTERSVTFYAQKLCVTPKYLSSVIHEVSGRYATDFITSFVVNECKAMLHTEGISVKEVCIKMNFPNQSFFAKYFKKHTGMTPKEYKQHTI
jgi:AraC-like DNA-binding protein